MDYEHDVFISYKREQYWTPWTRDHFKGLLKSYLGPDLGRPPSIFVDEHLVVGADWVDSLAENLARSRILVAIFSADYFGSDWCIHELDMMLERSRACLPATADDARLIVPAVVHDGDLIPLQVKRLHMAAFDKYWIAHINRDSLDYHDFSKAVKQFSPHVASAIDRAPPFDPKWIEHHKSRFNDVYNCVPTEPATFKLMRPSPPRNVPRPVPR